MKKAYNILFIDNNNDLTYSLKKYATQNIKWLKEINSLENTNKNTKNILKLKPDIIVCNNIYNISSLANNEDTINYLKNNCNIFILSGNNDYNLMKESYSFGTLKYIFKPAKMDDIFNTIKQKMKI